MNFLFFVSEGQIKEDKSGSSSPINLKHGSPAKPEPNDSTMTETKRSPGATRGATSTGTTPFEEPLSIKVEEKVGHGQGHQAQGQSQGHPERKRRASDDSIDVSVSCLEGEHTLA